MGRMTQSRTLGLWMNGSFVGRWSITASGEHRLNYASSWLESSQARPISLSLPLQAEEVSHRGEVVKQFFDNLLPDSDAVRDRIRMRFGTHDIQAFSLLSEIGRDCIGALQILPETMTPDDIRSIRYREVTEEEIEAILVETPSQGHFRTRTLNDFRISIAGAQEKTALLLHKGSWAVPMGTTPSTHIFKLPIGRIGFTDMSTSVENEWLCSQIIGSYGLQVAACQIARFGTQKALIVKRFDRILSDEGSWIIRQPQEDMCQATGTGSARKYESDGGPGIQRIMDLLAYGSAEETDRRAFFKAQILFWLLAAPDGHAKNFSIFIRAQGGFVSTPLYDILSAYPVIGTASEQIHQRKIHMAMAVTGVHRHYRLDQMRRDHWITTGRLSGLSAAVVDSLFDEIIEATPKVITLVSSIIPPGFPEQVADSILGGLQEAVRRL
ncbi:MAG: type II toxin-antitoxin system HipA family toxin [Spirochaetia bacterium]|nr:type II toxin-antitoxin system HipA family toxin [Spirochaetia bacterium]